MDNNSWGTKIWNFFHTLAEKISDQQFLDNRTKILELIKESCNYLPCPKCTSHSQYTLNYALYNKILSKDDLKIFLLQFHNLVNLKNNKSPFTRALLEEKYSKFEFKNTINSFISVYNLPNRTNNLNIGMKKKAFLEKFIPFIKHLTIIIN